MINGIYPLPVQAAVQAVTESTVVSPFEAAAAWIDDVAVVYSQGS